MKEGLITAKEGQKILVFVLDELKEYRGIPRRKVVEKFSIFPGDRVRGKILDEKHITIEEVLERKNVIYKPNLANIDRAFVVATLKEPEINYIYLDKVICAYEYSNVEVTIILNKIDIVSKEEIEAFRSIYEPAGYSIIPMSVKEGYNVERILEVQKEGIIVLSGMSGVGKSSIIRALTGMDIRIGDISRKLGRGKQTTTGTRLYRIGSKLFLADTPGFSRIDITKVVPKEALRYCFREFLRYRCAFSNCMHVGEQGCAIVEAVEKGEIHEQRYRNYLRILKEYDQL